MNISIVIPNYNGEKLLKKNLPKIIETVKEYKKGFVEIIIPDDASKDNSLVFLETYTSQIQNKNIELAFIKSEFSTNQGFATNVNKGVSFAKGEIIILLNSDVSPHKDFLEPLLHHFSDEKVFAVGCLDESIENGKTILRGRGIGKWQRGFLMHNKGAVDKKNTLWVSCGSGAFRKRIWDTIGGLSHFYNPFYWEDIDLSYRAQKMGYKVIFEPKSIVIHEHESGIIKTQYSSNNVKKIAYRNQFFFVWLNISDIHLTLSHIFWLPYHIFSAISRRDGAFFIGLLLAVGKLHKIIIQRKFLQKLFIRSDTSILNEF